MIDPAVKLARMANQIASFFRAYPDEEAVARIHEHIVAFWSPRMRQDLAAALGRVELDPLVVAAFRLEGSDRAPAHVEGGAG